MLELAGRVGGDAAVDRAGLEHGAARRLEEAEALAESAASGRRSAALVAGADARRRRPGASHDLVDVERAGRGRAAGRGRRARPTLEEVGGLAVEHHADVEELLAVDARHAAQHDVLVGSCSRLMRHRLRQPLAGAEPGGEERDVRRPQRVRASRRPGTGSSQASGTSASTSAKTVVVEQPARPRRRRAPGRRRGSQEHVVGGVPRLRGEPLGSLTPPPQAWWK